MPKLESTKPTIASAAWESSQSLAFLVALLTVFASAGVAQIPAYRFDQWTTDNGLPQNTVRAIVQTRDGYLWLTTVDGLARFDGVRFVVFDKSNTKGLSSNRFTALHEDLDGTLWAGTEDNGVTQYRNGVFTSFTKADGFPSNQILSFSRASNGELIIVTVSGAYCFRNGQFVLAPSEYQRNDAKFYLGPSGTQWTIERHGIRQVKEGRVIQYSFPVIFSDVHFNLWPYEDRQGNLWVCDSLNLYRLCDGQIARLGEKDGLPPEAVLIPFCDDDEGGVWFAQRAGSKMKPIGTARFQHGRFTVYGSSAGLPPVTIGPIFKDREGTIWAGSVRGLFRLKKQLMTTYSTDNGLPHNEVYPMLQLRNGDVLVGTVQGLSRFRNGTFRDVPLGGGYNVQALYEDSNGVVWIGKIAGLIRYQNGKVKDLSEAVNNWSVWTIHDDGHDNLWVGTDHGLFKFNGDRPSALFTTKDGLPSDDVKIIHQDHQGTLWLGTYGGLAQLKDGKFTTYTTAQGLTGNRVRSIYEDAEGTLWIGTYDDGLSRFRDGKFVSYRVEHGLYNNGVFKILEDRRGNFWISCNKGIYRVNRYELNAFADGRIPAINSIVYGKQDGMLNNECNGGRQPAGFIAGDGKFWFPTQGGVVVVDPEAVPSSPQPPPVRIETVTLERGLVDFRDTVVIGAGQRDLEISYTGLSFIKPDQIKFRYKLEGLDNDWRDAGTRRVAYFPYLPPGSYTFQVIAANSDGPWNAIGQSLRVVVLPPVYRTWWFLSLAALAVGGIGYTVYRYRIAQLEEKQASQQAFSRQLIASQERERQRLAADLHDSLSQNLVIIKNRAMISLQQADDHEEMLEQVTEIAEAADHALFEVREIAHNLRPFQIDRLGLTKALEALVRKAGTGGLQFTSRIDKIDSLLPAESEINLYRIIQESINNIIKHSRATEASVRVECRDQSIEVTILDNGCGFTPGITPRTPQSTGSGMGLTGITERARILGCVPMIESNPGQGTKISLQIRTENRATRNIHRQPLEKLEK